MAIDIRHNSEREFLIITVTGQLCLEEYKAIMGKITQSEQYPADINALWDVREQDFSCVTSSSVDGLIEISEQYPERGASRVAFIVGANLAYGMLRMYELSLSIKNPKCSQKLRVFRDYSEGENWLFEDQPQSLKLNFP